MLAIHDATDLRIRNTELTRHIALSATLTSSSDFFYNFRSELGACDSFATRNSPVPYLVSAVFCRGSVTKVLDPIVGAVSVEMRDLASLWPRPDKCLRDQVCH